MATRIYAIRNAEESEIIALVEAKSEAEAYRHVARTSFDVSVATPRECADAGASGVKIEVAGEEVEAVMTPAQIGVESVHALQEKATMMARLIEAPLPISAPLDPATYGDSIIVHADPEEAKA